MNWRRNFAQYGAIGAMLIALAWLGLAVRLESFVNTIEASPLPEISSIAQNVHDTSFVADLHADSLLFGRDLLKRSTMGHVDLPRLQEGGVGLQVFGFPSIVPLGTNIHRTESGGLDSITLAGIVQLSPTAWLGPSGRALYRADQLASYAEASNGALSLIRDRGDLAELLAARANGAPVTGALLAIEGAHAMESKPENLRLLFDAGYRMIGLAHFFDNDYAGSSAGVRQGGLTELGRRTLQEMESLGITADVAHLSPTAINELLDLATKPVVFSHGGVRGTCDNPRNLSDEQVRRIAEGGGIIGLGYWNVAACGRTPEDIARSIAYVVNLVGADYAALGSDYDGGTEVGFDTSALPALTQALFDANLSEEQIRKVLGENVLRVLSATLPSAASALPADPPETTSGEDPATQNTPTE